MKYKTSLLVGLASLAALVGAIADTAVTDPVGYITHNLAGNAAGGSSGADTYIAPALTNKSDFVGTSTAAPAGKVITFASGVPAGLTSASVVEISSGTREGWWSTIASSSATTITTTDDFPSGLGAAVSVKVYKLTTLKDFLGANAPGLAAFDGSPTAKPDEVQFLNPVTQEGTTAVYATAAAGVTPGWYNFVDQSSMDDTPIYPGTAIKIRHYAAAPLNFVSVGYVKTNDTEVDLYPQTNWIQPNLAVGGSLGQIKASTNLLPEDGDDATNPPADQLQVLSLSQEGTVYVALAASIGGGIVNFVDQTDASGVVIPEGAGFVIKRAATASPSIWVIPGQEVK